MKPASTAPMLAGKIRLSGTESGLAVEVSKIITKPSARGKASLMNT